MASKKDKDYHKLRNPEKYGIKGKTSTRTFISQEVINGCYHTNWENIPITKEEGEALKAYEKLHNKYGGKSMVADKRRRNSTRKSNQRNKKTMSRIRRAQEKEGTRNIVNDKTEIVNRPDGGDWGL